MVQHVNWTVYNTLEFFCKSAINLRLPLFNSSLFLISNPCKLKNGNHGNALKKHAKFCLFTNCKCWELPRKSISNYANVHCVNVLINAVLTSVCVISKMLFFQRKICFSKIASKITARIYPHPTAHRSNSEHRKSFAAIKHKLL